MAPASWLELQRKGQSAGWGDGSQHLSASLCWADPRYSTGIAATRGRSREKSSKGQEGSVPLCHRSMSVNSSDFFELQKEHNEQVRVPERPVWWRTGAEPEWGSSQGDGHTRVLRVQQSPGSNQHHTGIFLILLSAVITKLI